MKKIIGLLILIILIFIPLTSCLESELTVKVHPEDILIIRVLAPNLNEEIVLGTIEMEANSDGIATKVINYPQTIVWFKLMVYEDSAVKKTKYFRKAYELGKPIYLDIFEVENNTIVEAPINETVEEINVTEEENLTATTLSGNTITDTETESANFSSTFLLELKKSLINVNSYLIWTLFGVMVLFIIAFVLKNHFLLFGKKQSSDFEFGNTNRRIRVAELQIKKAKEKIRKLQNKERIKALEQKIKDERKNLKVYGNSQLGINKPLSYNVNNNLEEKDKNNFFGGNN